MQDTWGVGAQTEYRVDTVTVVMRIVSVSTGSVLLSVATEKTIASSEVELICLNSSTWAQN